MAYKDILVYLDPTAEAVERVRFAAGLAKTHGARLIAVDASAPAEAEGIDPASTTRRMFDDATRASAIKGVFVSTGQSGESGAFGHCVDLIVAPAPGGESRNATPHGLVDRALIESGAPVLILPPGWAPGPVGDNV